VKLHSSKSEEEEDAQTSLEGLRAYLSKVIPVPDPTLGSD